MDRTWKEVYGSGIIRRMAMGSRLGFMVRALGHRNYRLFFTGQIVSLCGTWMQNIALPYFVYTLTGSPLAVAVA